MYILAGPTNVEPKYAYLLQNINVNFKIIDGCIFIKQTTYVEDSDIFNKFNIASFPIYDISHTNITMNYKIINDCGCCGPSKVADIIEPTIIKCYKLNDDYYDLDYYKITLIDNKFIVSEKEINIFNNEQLKHFKRLELF